MRSMKFAVHSSLTAAYKTYLLASAEGMSKFLERSATLIAVPVAQ